MGGVQIEVAEAAVVCLISGVTLVLLLAPPRWALPAWWPAAEAGGMAARWRTESGASWLELSWPRAGAPGPAVRWRHDEPGQLWELARAGAWHRAGGQVALVLCTPAELPDGVRGSAERQVERWLSSGAERVAPQVECSALYRLVGLLPAGVRRRPFAASALPSGPARDRGARRSAPAAAAPGAVRRPDQAPQPDPRAAG
jgi:hypothetical protein